jgi:hypothetical protein
MTDVTVDKMLGKIMAIFGKATTGSMTGVCRDTCREFPDSFADFAVDQARDLDRMPGNISKFLRDSWFRWREANPSLSAMAQDFGCKFCHRGMIFYVQHRDGYGWLPFTAICGHCRPRGLHVTTIRTFGGEIVPPHRSIPTCLERNGTGEVPEPGEDFASKLKGWRSGQRPYERAIPDDDYQEREGW